jgi:hypothetical protein|nr:MAG TPA: hypothetical protein [Bacteriophage sp.]
MRCLTMIALRRSRISPTRKKRSLCLRVSKLGIPLISPSLLLFTVLFVNVQASLMTRTAPFLPRRKISILRLAQKEWAMDFVN